MTKSLTHYMGGYLLNMVTEMWEPSRDFAFFRLPTSGVRSVVALSGWVFFSLPFLFSFAGFSFVGCLVSLRNLCPACFLYLFLFSIYSTWMTTNRKPNTATGRYGAHF